MKKRIECAGGCGTMVLAELGECRKCRRARVLAGKRHMAKMLKGDSLEARFRRLVKRVTETAKQKFQRLKSVRWARPKRTIRGLYIPDGRAHYRPIEILQPEKKK